MDGFTELTFDKLKNGDGINELNRMLIKLFDNTSGDGDSVRIYKGYGTPEGAVTAGVGSIYMRLDGGSGTTQYRKESGTGATGWVASSNFVLSGYTASAWVNFNGTGTVAIRASGNVSSITDNGTGDYTINFTTAMPDANYCCVFGSAHTSDSTNKDQGWLNLKANNGGTDMKNVAYVSVWASSKDSALGAAVDNAYCDIAIFR